jgi:hypothetical protein
MLDVGWEEPLGEPGRLGPGVRRPVDGSLARPQSSLRLAAAPPLLAVAGAAAILESSAPHGGPTRRQHYSRFLCPAAGH